MNESAYQNMEELHVKYAPYPGAEFLESVQLSNECTVGIYRVDNGTPEGEDVLVRLPLNVHLQDIKTKTSETIDYEDDITPVMTLKERARLLARDIFMVPDGEDGIQMALALPYDILEMAQNVKKSAITVSESFADQIDIPESLKKVVTVTVAAGILLGSLNVAKANDDSDVTKLDNSEQAIEQLLQYDGINVSYTEDATVVTLPKLIEADQNPSVSVEDAIQASGLQPKDIKIIGEEIVLPRNATNQQIMSAVISAAAPDVNVVPKTSTTNPTTTNRPSVAEAPKPAETVSDEEFINWLADSVNVTAEDYKVFDVDTSRAGVFAEEMTGNKIQPTAFVGHWTAGRYPDGVDQFISVIKNREGNCCSVMYFMDKDAKVYRLTASWEQTAHARGANDYTQGVEIEARDLRDYTPEQMSAFVKLGYRFMVANDIPIERKNFIGHMELGTGKIDMPPELVDKLFVKLQELDNEIKNGNSTEVPVTPGEISYDGAVSELLAEIRQHEGDFDAINRGDAGDTTTNSSEYKQALGGRKLTELTIQEILDLQTRGIIKAVGGYQFIPGTFNSAVESTGIDVNRRFDEATQNELAVNYLLLGGKRKTLTAYLKGESDNIDGAANDMCKEWASIPCANGEIYPAYNISGNAAKGGVEQYQKIRQMLINIRTAHDQKNNPTTAPEAPVSNNKVVLIGDSLTVGYNRFGKISEVDDYANLDLIVSDGVGGRPLVGGEDDGVHAVERHIDAITKAGTVIIGLGTNAPEDDEIYKSEMEKIVNRIHSPEINPTANILLISGYSYEDGTKSAERRDRRASILDDIADNSPNVFVLDVSNVLTNENFEADNIHLTSEGYKNVTAEILKRTSEILQTSAQLVTPQPVVTTTQSTTTLLDASENTQELPKVPENDFSWFSEQQTRHIYEPYFRNQDGSIDTEGLDSWIVSLQKAVDSKGTIKYQVSISNTPNNNNGE
jgi:hypothetical protein